MGGAVLQLEIRRRSVTGETLGVEPPHQHRQGLLASHQGVLRVMELGVHVLLGAVGSAGCRRETVSGERLKTAAARRHRANK